MTSTGTQSYILDSDAETSPHILWPLGSTPHDPTEHPRKRPWFNPELECSAGCQIVGRDFLGEGLYNVEFTDVDFIGCNFGSKGGWFSVALMRCTFIDCTFEGSEWTDVQTTKCTWIRCRWENFRQFDTSHVQGVFQSCSFIGVGLFSGVWHDCTHENSKWVDILLLRAETHGSGLGISSDTHMTRMVIRDSCFATLSLLEYQPPDLGDLWADIERSSFKDFSAEEIHVRRVRAVDLKIHGNFKSILFENCHVGGLSTNVSGSVLPELSFQFCSSVHIGDEHATLGRVVSFLNCHDVSVHWLHSELTRVEVDTCWDVRFVLQSPESHIEALDSYNVSWMMCEGDHQVKVKRCRNITLDPDMSYVFDWTHQGLALVPRKVTTQHVSLLSAHEILMVYLEETLWDSTYGESAIVRTAGDQHIIDTRRLQLEMDLRSTAKSVEEIRPSMTTISGIGLTHSWPAVLLYERGACHTPTQRGGK